MSSRSDCPPKSSSELTSHLESLRLPPSTKAYVASAVSASPQHCRHIRGVRIRSNIPDLRQGHRPTHPQMLPDPSSFAHRMGRGFFVLSGTTITPRSSCTLTTGNGCRVPVASALPSRPHAKSRRFATPGSSKNRHRPLLLSVVPRRSGMDPKLMPPGAAPCRR